MDLKSKIILISGPTASGKSNFAISLAKKINGEIINADSMQVYKELRTLTARPKQKDYKKIRHHLYGFLNVTKNFSTGKWLKLCQKKIKEIQSRNKIPILVGGTGLYFKALTDGLVKIPNIPLKVRNKIRNLQKKLGQKKFYSKLLKLDPQIKGKIIETDAQRSIRAYEVKYHTKKSLYDWFKNTKSKFQDDVFFKIYIDYPRPKLIERIAYRSGQMLKDGAINEVKRFLKLKIKKDNSSNKVIGIAEIKEYLENKLDLKEVHEKISIKTRQYAKRQSTWARGQMSSWNKINSKDLKKFLKKI
ncbi:tRNA (adenosine(37)-N6)-dimethylallyltransferase MiaA [Candidatus Pelagibacter sp.]|nr:tRNA (adenosine(37)-N6)-dimethylallyltransferase MiaA [Candidatus Pelagibacter sp.]